MFTVCFGNASSLITAITESNFTKGATANACRSIKSPVVGFVRFGNQLVSHTTFIGSKVLNDTQ